MLGSGLMVEGKVGGWGLDGIYSDRGGVVSTDAFI